MNKDNEYANTQDESREGDQYEDQYQEDGAEVEQELSEVASNPKQNLVILVGIGLVFLYVFYSFFIASDEDEDKKTSAPVPTALDNPSNVDASGNLPSIPTLPSPPKLEDPTLPPPPPIAPEGDEVPALDLPAPQSANAPNLPTPQTTTPDLLLPPSDITPSLPDASIDDDQERARIKQKRSSSIVLISGIQQRKTAEELQQETDFKYRGNMNLMLARGKLIEAAIETAVNTDMGGEIRAIVTRDVYSEWGKNILVPKGSKIFGAYTKGIDGSLGYGRIAIAWNRLDLINGYSVNLGNHAVAADDLGRQGVQGRVDNKFKEQFSNAVLRSAFNIALANVLDSIVEPTQNSQEAATQNTQASSIRNIANSATASSENQARSTRENVCGQVLVLITDKTSTTFETINKACNDLRTQTGSTELEKLTSIKNTINAAADGLIQGSVKSSDPTKAQKAAEESFSDISDTVKKMMEQEEFKPTITLDQGTHIKIYVNKDFVFPKEAVGRTRRLR